MKGKTETVDKVSLKLKNKVKVKRFCGGTNPIIGNRLAYIEDHK